jgi:hypothetical protein
MGLSTIKECFLIAIRNKYPYFQENPFAIQENPEGKAIFTIFGKEIEKKKKRANKNDLAGFKDIARFSIDRSTIGVEFKIVDLKFELRTGPKDSCFKIRSDL